MDYSSVHHEAKSAMAYAYDHETVHLRLRAKKGLLKKVTLIAGDPFQYSDKSGSFEWVKFENETSLTLEATTATHDVFFIAIKPPYNRVKYAFILDDKALYGTREIIDLTVHPELKTNLFNYFNFPAFSPSSNWIQTNYKKGKSGFVMFNYLNNQVNEIPYFFNWVR